MEARHGYGIIRSKREVLELPAKATSPGPISVWALDYITVPGPVGIKKDFSQGICP